jgi:hypothetical protein
VPRKSKLPSLILSLSAVSTPFSLFAVLQSSRAR